MATPEPFADFIGVTVPAGEWSDLHAELVPELEGLGMSLEVDSGLPEIVDAADRDARGVEWLLFVWLVLPGQAGGAGGGGCVDAGFPG